LSDFPSLLSLFGFGLSELGYLASVSHAYAASLDHVHAAVHVLDALKGSVDTRGFGDVFHEGIVS
jgi:hypothetical protein